MNQQFYSNGKLLITGEYLVLDGAQSLALPTKFGQSLTIDKLIEPIIDWKSLDHNEEVWFQDTVFLDELDVTKENDELKETTVKNRIIKILIEAKKLNSSFLTIENGFKITTKLDFPKNWGLGSSSTLLNNIATWAQVDAFKLSQATFGGSGYDIAAAQNNLPILYTNSNNSIEINSQSLAWNFTEQLFFIHLNKKQNSREGISHYNNKKENISIAIAEINSITSKICNCNSLSEFEKLITKHEEIISEIIQEKPIKQKLFKDYSGAIKSLGAWGGDFILVTGNVSDMIYFKEKGFETILTYQEMIL